MTGKGRPICPGCGSSRVVFLSNTERRPRRKTEKSWRCRSCEDDFDEPERTSKESSGPRHGMAAQLADPSVTSVDDIQSEG